MDIVLQDIEVACLADLVAPPLSQPLPAVAAALAEDRVTAVRPSWKDDAAWLAIVRFYEQDRQWEEIVALLDGRR